MADQNDISLDELCDLEAAASRATKSEPKAKTQLPAEVKTTDPEVEEMIAGVGDPQSKRESPKYFMVQKGNPPTVKEVSSKQLPRTVRKQEDNDIEGFSQRNLRSAELLSTAFTSPDFAKACLDAYLEASRK